MLRSFSHIILSVLLLTTTMGMAVSEHFCNGTFVSLKLFREAESCCDDDKCCHNENHFYKVQDDFSAAQIQNAPQLAEIDIIVSFPGSFEFQREA